MQMKIKSNASKIYTESRFNATFPSKSTLKMLQNIEGKTLEVDTNWLNVSEFKMMNGDKINEIYVEEFIDDVRDTMKRCGDCGFSLSKEFDHCPNCDCDYFTSLQKENELVKC